MTDAEETAFCLLMTAQGLMDIKRFGNGWYGAVRPFLFTHAIIIGEVGDSVGYVDRWCYRTYDEARSALAVWDGEGEPSGWHRHPATGRRICHKAGTISGGREIPVGETYVEL